MPIEPIYSNLQSEFLPSVDHSVEACHTGVPSITLEVTSVNQEAFCLSTRDHSESAPQVAVGFSSSPGGCKLVLMGKGQPAHMSRYISCFLLVDAPVSTISIFIVKFSFVLSPYLTLSVTLHRTSWVAQISKSLPSVMEAVSGDAWKRASVFEAEGAGLLHLDIFV